MRTLAVFVGLAACLAGGTENKIHAAERAAVRATPAVAGPAAPVVPVAGPYWGAGGDSYSGTRVGSPYYWSGGGYGGYGYGGSGAPGMYGSGFGGGTYGANDAYLYHYGPGFHRSQDYAHYRFPYYSYRRPWYFPGHPSYNRDTNFPW